MTHENEPASQRVRPWVAALLSFLGWGLGFYYAGQNRLAYLAAGISALVGILGLIAFLIYLNFEPVIPPILLNEGARDFAALAASAAVGAIAWRVSVKNKSAPNAGANRLFGYVLIFAAPIAFSVLLAFSIRAFLFQPFNVPSASMEPTIQRGGFVFASKREVGYGPYSFAPFPGPKRKNGDGDVLIEAGDIVVFRNTKKGNEHRVYRIIGMPGDTLESIGGRLVINGLEASYEFERSINLAVGSDQSVKASLYRESLPSGVNYLIADSGPSSLDYFTTVLVPENSLFLMGDNRDYSADSRVAFEVGLVPIDNVIGKVRKIAHIRKEN